ncbi:MAG: ATP-binding protein [Leptospira sp.]|nr:ATP-binding protein [Leptospira sp.]
MEEDFLYVDKTRQIYPLIEKSGAFFLSRPRRFGKSLTLSVLDEIFSGNRELFQGLWIYDSPWEWKKHPVLRFDFSKQKARTTDELKQFIFNELEYVANRYSLQLTKETYFDRFQELIIKCSQISENSKVVILIDEYDKPIIDHLEDTPRAVEMREIKKGFFTVLKGCDPYIRFLLLTGVSKFSKAGVFSNLNHLRDISLEDQYSDLIGITEDELTSRLADYIHEFAKEEEVSDNELVVKIRDWYNGYRFSPKGISVYNPFSTLLLLQQKRFEHHWFETGTPEFLVKLILNRNYNIISVPLEIEASKFSSYEVEDLNITPLLFQTGYLTIKGYDKEESLYILDYPNYEVKYAFLNYLLMKMQKYEDSIPHIHHLAKSFRSGDLHNVIEILRRIFLSIDYDLHIPLERYYQTIFYLIFTLLGLRIKTEVKTNLGRVDAVVETASTIYIFEFKLDDTAEKALEQIREKKYYEKYQGQGKAIVLVGVEFRDRNIGKWLSSNNLL